jgi:rhodanese-related sulfurtransferase
MYKRTSTAFIGAVLSLALLPGCFFGDGQKTPKTGVIVVNVLDKKQYDDCHIAGSINIPFKEIDAFASTVDKEKSDIVFYCSNYMCSASGYAADKFVKLGFKQVAAYEGGTAEWYQRGLPTDGPAQESYLKVVMDKPAHEDGATLIINADELAQKMGIALPIEK